MRSTLKRRSPILFRQMTRGLVRYQQSGDFHFLTFSCHNRLPFISSPESKNLFEFALERIRRSYGFVVAGYVVMPEHVPGAHVSKAKSGAPASVARERS